jgi:hypothetical protein
MSPHTTPPDYGIPSEDAPESIARREALATLAALAAGFMGTSLSAAQLVTPQVKAAGTPAPQKFPTGPHTDADIAARAVLDGMVNAHNRYRLQARLTGVTVMGIQAFGGRLDGPSLAGLFAVPTQSPSVQPLIAAFQNAAASAWDRLAASVKVPGLPWYPAFAAFPGPQAPPMPNIPMPFITLWFDPSPFLPPNLAAAIRAGLGARANDPGAAQAIDRFSREFAAKFYYWACAAQVMTVLGKGPIPTFAPPYVPIGPVIGGTAEGPGCLLAAPAWPG